MTFWRENPLFSTAICRYILTLATRCSGSTNRHHGACPSAMTRNRLRPRRACMAALSDRAKSSSAGLGAECRLGDSRSFPVAARM